MLFLFTFVGSWTNFFWPFIVLRGSEVTLPVALQQLQAAYFKDYSLIMSGVVISVVPLLLLFLVVGRQLVHGIMQGAVSEHRSSSRPRTREMTESSPRPASAGIMGRCGSTGLRKGEPDGTDR